MNISILCTDPQHPVNPWLQRWMAEHAAQHRIQLVRCAAELQGGELLFLVSCHEIIRKAVRDGYAHTLVLHASDLPQGRGMSPHVWQIIQGASAITVTLLDAVDKLDEGDVWQQRTIEFDGTELHDEIHARLFDAEVTLMSWAVSDLAQSQPRPQSGEPGPYFRKRKPQDSCIDVTRPLAEAFDLLRIADAERYPAYFEHRGQRYRLRIDKL